MKDFPCKCGHKRSDHRTIDRVKILKYLERTGGLFYAVDKIGYVDNTGNYYPIEETDDYINKLQECSTSCDKKFFSSCSCSKFVADNLRYLEQLYVQKTR